VLVLTTSLTYTNFLPPWLLASYIIREIGLVGGGFYMRYKTLPKDAKFFDVSASPSLNANPNLISKFNTAFQIGIIAQTLCQMITGFPSHDILFPQFIASAIITIASGASYLDGSGLKRIVKTQILKRRKKSE